MRLMFLAAAFITTGVALYFYFRPPQGDLEPISSGSLDHIKRMAGRQGDID